MKFNEWLHRQVAQLEKEIAERRALAELWGATPEELVAIQKKVVIHIFLKQQLLRREPISTSWDEEFDTQEFELVKVQRHQ